MKKLKQKLGFYWNPSSWELKTAVVGCQDRGCYRIPCPLVALLGPVLGAIYFISVPLIGFFIVVGLLLGELARPFVNLWKLYDEGRR